MRLDIAEKVIDVFREARIPPEETLSILAGLLKTGIAAAEAETKEKDLMDEVVTYLTATSLKRDT